MVGYIRRNLISSGSFLIVATLLSHVINLAYSAYIGRELSLAEFGLITFIGTGTSVISVVFSAISATVNYHVGYLTARYGLGSGKAFHNRLQKKFIGPVIAISFIWLLLSQQLATYFHTGSIWPIIIFLPILLIGFFTSISAGFIKGRFLFQLIGLFYILEAVTKFAIASLFITSGFLSLAYLAVPISIIASSLATIASAFIVTRNEKKDHHYNHKFSTSFFSAAYLTGFASNAFLTIDILMVKHFFQASDAGIYALLALIGKMIFFFGSLLNTFIISLVSRDQGAHRDPIKNFYVVLLATVLLTFSASIGLFLIGPMILPLVFGAKISQINPYLLPYGLAIAFYTISTTINTYHLAKKHYFFSVLSLMSTVLLVYGITIFHSSLDQVVWTILTVSIINTALVTFTHMIQRNGGFFLMNLVDLFDLFSSIPKLNYTPLGKRILIFNWRDTKHVFAGGAETYIHELGKRWVKDGNSVTVFCGNDGNCSRYESVEGVNVIRRGGFYMVYFWAMMYYIFKLRGKFDIIIDCENGIPFFTPLYAKEKKYLLIHHVHQEVFRKSLIWPLSSIASWLEIKLMPFVYQRIQFITVSPSTKEEIFAHKLTTIEPLIIFNGVDRLKYKLGKKSATPLILYLGRLQYYKSINVFIKLARDLSKKYPKSSFVIAGEGEELTKLKAYAHRIQAPVTFLGKVSEEEKVKLLQKAWVMVNPSSMEGWGLTVIEANACGTPVVASDVPGLRDSVKKDYSGLLAKYGDVNDFEVKVASLLKDKKLRNQMAINALKWAKLFNWDAGKKKSIDLFNNRVHKDLHSTISNKFVHA